MRFIQKILDKLRPTPKGVLWDEISLKAKKKFVKFLSFWKIGCTIRRFQELIENGTTNIPCFPCVKAYQKRDISFDCGYCSYAIMFASLSKKSKRALLARPDAHPHRGSINYFKIMNVHAFCCKIHTVDKICKVNLQMDGGNAIVGNSSQKEYCEAVITHWEELLEIKKGLL